MKEKLLKILADGKFYSGAMLGDMLGLSRSAVWKHIQSLSEYGLDIHAVSGKGYRLSRPLDLLDANGVVQMALQRDAQLPVRNIDILFEVDSTNRYLLEKHRSGFRQNAVCFAEYQRAGRGRRGRTWVSPFACNLYCSILWHSGLPLNMLSTLGLAVGVAVCRALRSTGLSNHNIKWPNDIYWANRKLGGILIETSGELSAPGVVVIGIGLNVDMPPTMEIDQPWCDLKTALGAPVSRNALAGALLHEVFSSFSVFELQGFDAFLGDWQNYDLLYEREVSVQTGEKTIIGVAEGVDNQGALLVRDVQGQVSRYFSGDVSVRYGV